MTNHTNGSFEPRYTPGRFRDCPWCKGRGCAACDGEAEKAYKRAVPDGPKPIATFNTDDPEDVAAMKACIGGDALRHAFGEHGGGLREIFDNLRQAHKLEE
jgi:hypothetical protein